LHLAGAVHGPEYETVSDAGGGRPGIHCYLYPRRHRYRPHTAVLSHQVHDAPTPVALLDVGDGERCHFRPPQPAAQEDRQDRTVTEALPYAGIRSVQQRLRLPDRKPVRQLHDEVVKPIAVSATKGAWYGAWRLVSLDGSTLDVADEKVNEDAFGRPGASRGSSAYPQIRFVSLVENGTHVLFGSQMDAYTTGEITLSKTVLPCLRKGMLCLADRQFFGYELWKQARATGADLLWRVKKNMRLACEERLPDGSYLSRIYPSERDWRHKTNGIVVRAIDYQLEGVAGAEPIYRLVTSILDHEKAPAQELAALYHDRWEIETALDELKTHLRGAKIVLRSKTPDLVRQEFYGLLMAHFAIRGLMHEAALKAKEDPDRLSFLHAVRVVRRKLPVFSAIPPSAEESVP
jgi:hypothetical protein